MRIDKPAKAGSLESNDILIMLFPAEEREIHLESPVKATYGSAILRVINETLDELGVEGCKINATDKGALDYCIRARVKSAVTRSIG